MKCSKAQARLTQYLDGELTEKVHTAIARHLEGCVACRRELESLRAADDALQLLAAVEPAPDLTSDLRRRLDSVPAGGVRWVPAALAAGVAVLLVVLCIRLVTPRAPLPEPSLSPAQEAPAQVATRPPPLALEPAHLESQVPAPIAHTPTTARPPARRSADVPSAPSEPSPHEAPPAEATEAPAPPPVETASAPDGLILILGEPQPVLPSSYCYFAVTRPDGNSSILSQTVKRDAAGEPRVVQMTYEETAPEPRLPEQGG
jgi:hypothetical protein